MPIVRHTLTRPGGAPMADEIIHIRLLASAAGEGEGFVAADQSGILSEYKLRTDSTGTWSLTLTANALITPANTVYQVIQPGVNGAKVTETFVVPDAAGPFWLGDILATPPAGLPGYALDLHNESLTAHGGPFVTFPAVTLVVDDEANSMLPIGIDASNNRLYAVHDRTVRTLFMTTDPTLRSWASIHEFVTGTTLRNIWTLASGTLLASVTVSGVDKILRSTDSGTTWVEVLSGATASTLSRSICQLPNGNVFYGEYTILTGPYTLTLWKSVDDGATWTAAQTFPNSGASSVYGTRHMHFVLSDPYVTNRFWVGFGDTDNQSRVAYSDDDGATLNIIGSGDQSWRVVDMLFTPTTIVMADDASTEPWDQAIRIYDRATGVRTSMLTNGEGPFYFAVQDSAGRFAWTCAAEGVHIDAKVFTGNVNGLSRPRQVVTLRKLESRTDMYVFGPTADGRLFQGIKHVLAAGAVSRLRRFHLVDSDTGTEGLRVTNHRTTPPAASLLGGAPPVAGTEVTTAANRMFFVKVRPDVDMLISSISIGVGTVTGGDVVAGIAEINTSGQPATTIARSAQTTLGAIGLQQNLPLLAKAILRAGVEYWAYVQCSAVVKLRGADAGMGVSVLSRFLDGQAMPPPGPFTAAATTSIRPTVVLLT